MNGALGGPRFEKPIQRRNFLGMLAAWSFFGTIGAALLGALRLPMPAVFPESDSRFPIGKPEDFPDGSVIHIPRRRVWVFSDTGGIAAVSTVCPHLGCLVGREDNGNYTCPCHGSRFDATGKNVSGPAPRGLVWLDVSLGPDGRLIVDSGKEVDRGTRILV